MERLIKFSQFRNLGLEKAEHLILNTSFKKGEKGNLIVLIGANNSGKSNVLDGIKLVCNSSPLSQRDVTNLYFEKEYRNPEVSLIYKDDEYEMEFKSSLNQQPSWKFISGKLPGAQSQPTISEIMNSLTSIDNTMNINGYRDQKLIDLLSKISNGSIKEKEIYKASLEYMASFNSDGNFNRTYRNIWNSLRPSNELIRRYEGLKENDSKIEQYVAKVVGVEKPLPRLIEYAETKLSNRDLFTDRPEEIANHRFFNSLFTAAGIDIATIQNAYTQFRETNNSAVLNKLKKQIQPRIEQLNSLFNRMYFASSDKYIFTLDCESNRISFGMARGKDEDPIILEYQSVGFKWFFNLFFNFLATKDLNPGDIVIMDEPATNLHPQGQRELRAFIKDFAIKNDVLFIIATHSPFLIDSDSFDELRVVSMENNRSSIDNQFSAVNLNDPDSLLPIKDALTIKQNVLYDLDTEVVWVEGITDYNYLTMFKKLLDIKNISFLPFNGVGNNSAQTKRVLEKLIGIKFHKRSLLVDADKAGKDMYGQAKNSAFDAVHNLSEIKVGEKPAMMIEDLFSSEDKKKYPAIGNKNSFGTSIMKDHCKLSDFSKTTVDNFKKLFKLLKDED